MFAKQGGPNAGRLAAARMGAQPRPEPLQAAQRLDRLGDDFWLDARAAPPNPNLRLYSHPLGEAALAWLAPVAMAKKSKRPFPASLADMPILVPTGHSAVQHRLDQWFERQGLRPQVVGEFEDSALLAAFGRSGMGAFPASRWSHRGTAEGLGLAAAG